MEGGGDHAVLSKILYSSSMSDVFLSERGRQSRLSCEPFCVYQWQSEEKCMFSADVDVPSYLRTVHSPYKYLTFIINRMLVSFTFWSLVEI